ncbi:hypothetical protein SAMN05421828_102144 [Acidiphilium rubrum]|uniref:Uncharacterized protein n=1 Tax=Acidiphilium rubrum TaxID=526 RepID=A0A8G2CI42_ACIRU|nr:hypothetical protein SAMN05421828_102144 [Acidiphilium rubrum]
MSDPTHLINRSSRSRTGAGRAVIRLPNEPERARNVG